MRPPATNARRQGITCTRVESEALTARPMRISRVFVDQPLRPGATVTLDEAAARYVNQVLRLKRGQVVTLFNGDGGEFNASFLEVSRRTVKAGVESHVAIERESPLSLHLGHGLAKGERMDVAIQKAVELGASSITALNTERSVVKLSGERLERRVAHWRSIAIHACQQCGRNRIPRIGSPVDLESWVQADQSDVRVLLTPTGTRSLGELELSGNSVSLLVGPEGGMTEREENTSIDRGFIPIRIGTRVLRTETASVAGLTAIQLKWGDLG